MFFASNDRLSNSGPVKKYIPFFILLLISSAFSPLNGNVPVNNSYKITPRDQISLFSLI